MKYLPLILLLVFGCKKKSTEPIEPSPIVVTPVDTLTRKMSTVVFTYSTHCPGYPLKLNIKTSETGSAPYTFTTSIETKSSGTYTLVTDRKYVTYNMYCYNYIAGGQQTYCLADFKLTINGAAYTSTVAYIYSERIRMYQNW